MEREDLSQKMVIPRKENQSKSQEILEALKGISDDDIDNFCEASKDSLEEVEKQLRVDKVVNNLVKRHLKVEENVTEFGMRGVKVSANIWGYHYNYFIPDDIPLTLNKELIESNSYNSYEMEKMMVNIVKYLLSFSFIEKSDLYPGAPYVESVKKALRLDSWFWLSNKDESTNSYYGVNLKKGGFTFQHYSKEHTPKMLLKINE